MYTTESDLASYFADLVFEMKQKNIFNKQTTFANIAEYSDEQIGSSDEKSTASEYLLIFK